METINSSIQSHQYTVKVTGKMDEDIRQILVLQGMTKSEFLRTAIREYLERHK